MKAHLHLLRAEIASDRASLSVHLVELACLKLQGPSFDLGEMARAAVALDHAYSAVEAILARLGACCVLRTEQAMAPVVPGTYAKRERAEARDR